MNKKLGFDLSVLDEINITSTRIVEAANQPSGFS